MYRKCVSMFCWAALVAVLVGCASACSKAPLTLPTPQLSITQFNVTSTPRLVSVTPTPSPTRLNPTPTRTLTPTRAPTATATATSAFLPLPADAILPTPFFTPAFPITLSAPYYPDTPTPIATPSAGNYQLKKWNEADGLALLRRMNQAAYDNDISGPGDFRSQFLFYQHAVNRAAREFLLRYPKSQDREQVEWLLAFTNALDRRDSEERLVAEITRRINNGRLDPDDLNSGLEPLGFVAYPARIGDDQYLIGQLPLKPVVNLFGDDAPAYIWEIQNSQEGYYGYGMFLAVEQLPDGSFRVARIYSRHNFPFAGGPIIDARDLTGDGQPELIIADIGCEFMCNTMNTYMYQWQENRFVELSHGNFGSEGDVTDGDYNWEYDQRNPNDSTVINITNSSMFEPDFQRTLLWNGEWFQIAGRQMELPDSESLVYEPYQAWIGYAMEYAEFNGIMPLFQSLLENPPEEQGSAFPDFIRFQMAMVEALSSRVGPAREQLLSIVDSPADPTRRMVAKAAAAFLKKYQGDADIFQSCHAAMSVVDRDLKPLRNSEIGSSERIIKERGYYSSSSLCSLRAALRLLLRSLSLKTGDDVTARLRQAGVPVQRSIKADFDGDKLADWLVMVDTPASESALEAWIFVDTGQVYSAVPVFDYGTRVSGLNMPIRIDTFPFPGDRQPAIVLQTGDVVSVFTVHHKGLTAEVELLLTINQVESFQVDPQANEIKVAYLPGAYDPHYDIYVWQEGLGNFLNISLVERLLFEQGNPEEAIRVIQGEISTLDPERYDYPADASRLYYLLGLAYELQGNPSAAVDAYLKVWREFPGSPYALMAREKIQ
jgi:hypothetical protein